MSTSNKTKYSQVQESKNKKLTYLEQCDLFKAILKIPEKNVQDRVINAFIYNNKEPASAEPGGESNYCNNCRKNHNQNDITTLLKIPAKQWINDDDFYKIFQNVDKDKESIISTNVYNQDGYNKSLKNTPMNTIVSKPLLVQKIELQQLPTVSDTLILNENNVSGTGIDKFKKITNKEDIDLLENNIQQNILHVKKTKQTNKLKPPDTANEGHSSNSTTNSTLKSEKFQDDNVDDTINSNNLQIDQLMEGIMPFLKNTDSFNLNDNQNLIESDQSKSILQLMQNEYENCLKADSNGNLPIHQAIINNDINHLKRQCYVFKFRETNTDVKTNDGNSSKSEGTFNGFKENELDYKDNNPIVKQKIGCITGAKTNWTDEMCRLLIEEIQAKECIWNVICKDYKSRLQRDLAWKHVSTAVGVYIDEAKIRWDGLRNAFRNAYKRSITIKSDDMKYRETPWYFDILQFLVPVINGEAKEKLANMPLSSNDSPIGKHRRVYEAGNKSIWTIAMCQLLIEEIKTRECLWNVKCKDYKIFHSRQLAWKQVSYSLGVYKEEVKYRWDSLRTSFRNAYNRFLMFESKQTTSKNFIMPWYFDKLQFLIPVIKVEANEKTSNLLLNNRSSTTVKTSTTTPTAVPLLPTSFDGTSL